MILNVVINLKILMRDKKPNVDLLILTKLVLKLLREIKKLLIPAISIDF